MKRPSFQFYPADWRKDPALSTCSIAARGLWIELMCVMHEAEIYGVLSINGSPMSIQQIARTVGESAQVVTKLMDELRNAGVFSIDENGCVYSRRMVKDERIRNLRSDAGRLGGNPNLLEEKVKQNSSKDTILLKQTPKQRQTPSSSSSSSTSLNPLSSSLRSEDSPPRRDKKQTFKAWLDSVKLANERPISTYCPVWDAAERLGLDREWIGIAWNRFVDRYTNDPDNARKRYIDWRRVFLNAITGNWFRLWYFGQDGKPVLTTAGVQADLLTRDAA